MLRSGDMTNRALGRGDRRSPPRGNEAISDALTWSRSPKWRADAPITAEPGGQLAARVDVLTVIPAQTMVDDRGAKLSVLPMGSLFETAQMIAFELAILKLRPRFGETSETMRARHTNLE